MSSKPSPLRSPAEETDEAGAVTYRLAAELEAVGAVERRKIEFRRNTRRRAEDDIGGAVVLVVVQAPTVHIVEPGADDDVVVAVAVDIAG